RVTTHTAVNAPVVISSSSSCLDRGSSQSTMAARTVRFGFGGGEVVDVATGAGDGVGFSGLNTSTGAGLGASGSGFGSGSTGRSTTSIGAVPSPRFSGTYRPDSSRCVGISWGSRATVDMRVPFAG